MLRYKIDVLKQMKKNGYNQTILQSNNILSGTTLDHLRKGNASLSMDVLDRICLLCGGLQPGDILEYVPDEVPNPKIPASFHKKTENITAEQKIDG